MSKIMDYILWRGDLSIDSFPLNQVDFAVLTQLPLLDLSNIFTGDEKLTLKDVFEKYESLGNDVSRRELLLIYRRVYNAFKLMAKSPRYMDILLSDYIEVVDLENPCQFSAITLEISNQVVVCYSGTDDKIVGWHEDFQLLYLDQIPSHKYGLRYLENIYNKTDKRIILCGHSKGANIAMNTLFYTSDEINSRIEKVYCFDGPGVNKTNFDNNLLKNRVEKIVAYIPYKSAVGKLFDHYENYKIVDCSANLLFQHDLLTWHVTTTDFIYKETESNESVYLDNYVKKTVSELDNETRKVFVSSLFNVFYISGVYNYPEVLTHKKQIIGNILKLKKDEKKIFKRIFLGSVLKDAKIRKMLISILKEKKKTE